MDTQRRDSTKIKHHAEGSQSSKAEGHLCVAYSPDVLLVGQRVALPTDGRPLSVGRDVSSQDLRINDQWMSRVHFRIAFNRHQSAFLLGDAQSRNGSRVNGERVETTSLDSGDVIRGGDTLFVFERNDPLEELESHSAQAATSPFPILITGETGVGKERLANRIHAASGRSGPLVAVNCAALPKDLVAAELFGHTRGAFSGAQTRREGLVMRAQGGTLFLDEIGDLPLEQQPALLRVLQERKVRPVGSDDEIPVDIHLVAATNVNVQLAIEQGRFREDLYARLAHIQLHIPPLRELRSHILPIVREILKDHGRQLTFDADAAECLILHSWPRNVRDLQALTHNLVVFAASEVVSLSKLGNIWPGLSQNPASTSNSSSAGTRSEQGSDVIARSTLRALLEAHKGNVAAVTKAAGVHRTQIYRWLANYGLDPRDFR